VFYHLWLARLPENASLASSNRLQEAGQLAQSIKPDIFSAGFTRECGSLEVHYFFLKSDRPLMAPWLVIVSLACIRMAAKLLPSFALNLWRIDSPPSKNRI
jgi:hypothetical protein